MPLNIEEMIAVWKAWEKDNAYTLSEIDTQSLFVESVLALAGWNIYNPQEIRRANRGNTNFDIEGYIDNRLIIAIESKALNSEEFNYGGIGKVGGLPKTGRNDNSDGIGQLRHYCRTYPQFKMEYTLPILTNGYEWVIFNKDAFLSRLDLPVNHDAVELYKKLDDDDFNVVIERIKRR